MNSPKLPNSSSVTLEPPLSISLALDRLRFPPDPTSHSRAARFPDHPFATALESRSRIDPGFAEPPEELYDNLVAKADSAKPRLFFEKSRHEVNPLATRAYK